VSELIHRDVLRWARIVYFIPSRLAGSVRPGRAA
jgi:hypothetical protein